MKCKYLGVKCIKCNTIPSNCKLYKRYINRESDSKRLKMRIDVNRDDYWFSSTELADILNVTQQRIDDIIRRALNKIKTELLKNPNEYPDLIQYIKDHCDGDILSYLRIALNII